MNPLVNYVQINSKDITSSDWEAEEDERLDEGPACSTGENCSN